MLIRHGETVGQSSIRLYGATDVALSAEGEQQVALSGRRLVNERFDAVFASPLQRARRSAEVVLEAARHPPVPVELVEQFREINFGRWEGWTWAEVAERDPEGLTRWKAEGPRFVFPDGEPRQVFVERVQGAVGPQIEARFAAGAERILVVVHKGVIKAIASRLLRRPPDQLDGLHLPLGALRRMEAEAAAGAWSMVAAPEDRPSR